MCKRRLPERLLQSSGTVAAEFRNGKYNTTKSVYSGLHNYVSTDGLSGTASALWRRAPYSRSLPLTGVKRKKNKRALSGEHSSLWTSQRASCIKRQWMNSLQTCSFFSLYSPLESALLRVSCTCVSRERFWYNFFTVESTSGTNLRMYKLSWLWAAEGIFTPTHYFISLYMFTVFLFVEVLLK